LDIPASALSKSLWRARIRLYYWKHYYWAGEGELMLLPQLVDRSRLAIDVGGNVGVYSYHLSRFAKSVVTFEPNPEYAEFLKAVGLTTRVETVALSSQPGEALLRFPSVDGKEYGGMASINAAAVPDAIVARQIPVPLRRLDDYDFKNVGFIKIDVEGHEEGVLAGAIETIRRDKPVILVEIEERSNPGGLDRISRTLSALGYAGSFLDRGRRRPLAEFDASVHQVWTSDVGRLGGNRRRLAYVNNFMFAPEQP